MKQRRRGPGRGTPGQASADPEPATRAAAPRTGNRAAERSPAADRPGRAYEYLRGLIVRGQLGPGSRLVEQEIAARLGISRTPVRGALQRLQQEGYVVASPTLQQARPTVAPLTRGDARELFGIVGMLEGLAAREAAALPAAERRALAAELRAVNAEFHAAFRPAARAARPDHARLQELDDRFHRRYVEAGAGPRLLALHDVVKPQAERYERLYVSLLVSEIPTSAAEHEAIVRAIAASDADAAQRAVQTNWRNAAERLATVIEITGERGSW